MYVSFKVGHGPQGGGTGARAGQYHQVGVGGMSMEIGTNGEGSADTTITVCQALMSTEATFQKPECTRKHSLK